jgi:hypothetical protein
MGSQTQYDGEPPDGGDPLPPLCCKESKAHEIAPVGIAKGVGSGSDEKYRSAKRLASRCQDSVHQPSLIQLQCVAESFGKWYHDPSRESIFALSDDLGIEG